MKLKLEHEVSSWGLKTKLSSAERLVLQTMKVNWIKVNYASKLIDLNIFYDCIKLCICIISACEYVLEMNTLTNYFKAWNYNISIDKLENNKKR